MSIGENERNQARVLVRRDEIWFLVRKLPVPKEMSPHTMLFPFPPAWNWGQSIGAEA